MLKKEFIEDIKENDEETKKMINTFMSHLESKIMAKRKQTQKFSKAEFEKALAKTPLNEM